MNQAQETFEGAQERVLPAFKRHILEQSAGFESEPMADMYRINLLGMMLERYDELREKRLSEAVCVRSVLQEYSDIAVRMHDAGFQENEPAEKAVRSRWPLMSEAEADGYIRESDARLHRQALGAALCTASVAPLMLGCAATEAFYSDFFVLFGLAGMFGVIGLGVYAIATAAKPKSEKKVRKGQFSLSARVRRKLMELSEKTEQRTRRRKGKGIAMIVASLMPLFVGVAFSEVWYSDAWPMIGMAGLFAMVGAGVYQLVMGDGEKKTIKKLLNSQDE